MPVTDRVFGCDSSTEQVYEEGAKEVALAGVSGINCEFTSLSSSPQKFLADLLHCNSLVFIDLLFSQRASLLMGKRAAGRHLQ